MACVSRAGGDHRFRSFPAGREGLARLIDRHRPAAVLSEACPLAAVAAERVVGQLLRERHRPLGFTTAHPPRFTHGWVAWKRYGAAEVRSSTPTPTPVAR